MRSSCTKQNSLSKTAFIIALRTPRYANFRIRKTESHICRTTNVYTHSSKTNLATNMEGEQFLYFVYGTLKKGFPNDTQIPPTVTHVGQALTKHRFPLVVDTEFHVPFLLDFANYEGSKRVSGELILVDQEARKKLDQFEGVGTGFYCVKPIEVIINELSQDYQGRLSTGQTVLSKAYFRDASNAGPSWAHKWTVERLLALPIIDVYTHEMGKLYTRRTHRS